MEKLVFAELVNGLSLEMLEDQKIRIISDGALFLVTTEKHSKNYPSLEFEETDIETLSIYGLKL